MVKNKIEMFFEALVESKEFSTVTRVEENVIVAVPVGFEDSISLRFTYQKRIGIKWDYTLELKGGEITGEELYRLKHIILNYFPTEIELLGKSEEKTNLYY